MTEGHRYTLHDPATDSDAEIDERTALGNALLAERTPDDPPFPVDVAIAAERARPRRLRRRNVRARDRGGALVGSASYTLDPDHDDNPEVLEVSLSVHPDHRRLGVGSQLLAEVVALAVEEARTRIFSTTSERVPAGTSFATTIEADDRQTFHVNQLRVDDMDVGRLQAWCDAGPVRAADYELISFDGPCPDEHLGGYVDQVLVLNTAPRDDVQVNDFTLTPDTVRENERVMEAADIEAWSLLARHVPTGEYAGLHDVVWRPSQPATVWVGLTTVDPRHRGRALGKWMKAQMTLRLLKERPDVVDIRTGNADSNDAMLGINEQMGYRPMIPQTVWELDVARAHDWVTRRGLVARAETAR